MIEAIRRQKKALPEHNSFGDPNHKIHDYMVKVLQGKLDEEAIWRLSENDEEITEDHASEISMALNWLQGDDIELVDEEHLKP